jgi:anthranilate phosphoribosyltransferase
MAQSAFALRGTDRFMTVKGLEGSCDLPRERTCIIGIHKPESETDLERLLLHPRDYGFDAAEVTLQNEAQYLKQLKTVLQGEPSELLESTVWNGGFYLWQSGLCPDLAIGLKEARRLLQSGKVLQCLQELHENLARV